MVPMTNLVYYASVARRDNVVLAEHKNLKEDLAEVGFESLEKVPPFHSRFSYTIRQRMFMFLMDEGFTYSAIVDEALGKLKSFGFLERVRDEFQLLIRSRGLDGSRFESYALVSDFAGVYKHLVKPLVGVPQKEVDLDDDQNSDSKDNTALSPSASHAEHSHGPYPGASSPLTGNGHKQDKRDHEVIQVKEIMMTNSNNSSKALDKGHNNFNQAGGGKSETEERKRGRQHASNLWWKNVKIVLFLDLVVCCILFAIWLGICRGFSCVNS
ncbi:hypothetical protein KC19_12G079400 [Ceratodon purpureus]|uniref:Longin domain-containing protein n=1 Tax=Ceratodon purpureus TaxID=3225 RepID=A0A8T0G614_CERPU|nr:hypothetical protein KC19_12G079400 [Ceratodon purpureus]